MNPNYLQLHFLRKLMHLLFCFSTVTVLCTHVLPQKNQDDSASHLTGHLIDRFGSLIPNVLVSTRDSNGKIREVKSNASGEYEILLPQGLYSITFRLAPYRAFSIFDYQMPYAGFLHLDVSLLCDGCPEVNSSKVLNRRRHVRVKL